MLNVNHQLINGNTNPSLQGYGKEMAPATTAGVAENGSVPASNGNSVLAGMNPGDVFNGEIINITNHDVAIRLNDNSVVNAVLKEALEMNIGQKIVFQVKDKNDDQVVIRPMPDKGVSPELVTKTLLGAGLTVNAKNSAIVSSLINAGQPIDRQNIIGHVRLSNLYGLENLDKVIEMNKLGIRLSPENIEMYGKYMASEHQLSGFPDKLSEGMNQYLDALFEGDRAANSGEIASFSDMLNSLSEAYEQAEQRITAMENGLEEGRMADGQNTASEIPKTLSGQEEETVTSSRIEEGENGKDDPARVASEKTEDMVKGSDAENRKADDKTGVSLKELSGMIRELSQEAAQGTIDEQTLGSRLSRIKQRLKENIQEHLRLDLSKIAEEDGSGKALKEKTELLYEKLSQTAQILKEHLSAEGKGAGLYKSAGELSGNLSFMSELNQMESYVQLPVRMNTKDANGDLYVYQRKRQKKNADDPLTAFLHLDLERLGATDVNISFKENAVTVQFTLDNADSARLVEKHLTELGKRLEKKGYQPVLTAGHEQEKDKTNERNPISPLIDNTEQGASIKRYSFDLRA